VIACEACRQSTSGRCAQHASVTYVVPCSFTYPAPYEPLTPPWPVSPYDAISSTPGLCSTFGEVSQVPPSPTVKHACDFLDRVKAGLRNAPWVDTYAIFTRGPAFDIDAELHGVQEQTSFLTNPHAVEILGSLTGSAAWVAAPGGGRDAAAAFLDKVKGVLIDKNRKYGDSAGSPIRVFSRASVAEQLLVRIDDKLSRIARGVGLLGKDEDVLIDLVGYFALLAGVIELSSNPK
jgi:hypothetical protein